MSSALFLVAGLGKTGLSIARYLQRHHHAFVAFDTRETPAGLQDFKAQFPEVPVFLGEIPPFIFPQLTEIISSPGVTLEHPSFQKARELGIPIIGDIECFAREVTKPVIAITGTNGKSTVTTLVGEMAKASGINVAVAGNIGTPVLDILDKTPADLWVLELSSFQLELLSSLAPLAATILNVTPDHLDRHHTLEAYTRAKQRIYQQASVCLHNRGDKATYPLAKSADAIVNSYGLDEPAAEQWGIREQAGCYYLSIGQEALFPVDKMKIKGKHNWENALAACALAQQAGVSFTAMSRVLESFKGLPHRSQWVRTLNGVEWINDSKGTNIGATLSAISGIGGSMQGKIVLIAGGQGKGADFTELRGPVADYVRSVVLIGEDAAKLEAALGDLVQISKATSLEAAVQVAKTQAQPGDVVLLSPACASLDMFKDFNHRGEQFAAAVEAL